MAPHLDTRTAMEGEFTTPHGDVAISHRKDATGYSESRIGAPVGTEIRLAMPEMVR